MALTLDPKLGQASAEGIAVALNGPCQESVAECYEISKGIGEDNPLVENVAKEFHEYEQFFNEQLVPGANRIRENFLANSDFATYFNSLTFTTVKATEDVGTIASANYDAAKDL